MFGLSTLNKCSVVVWNSGPKQEYQTRDNDDCDDAFHILSISSVFVLSSRKKNAKNFFCSLSGGDVSRLFSTTYGFGWLADYHH
jgi:hypothetical protein